ncbi:MAG: spore cortex biosynthesis protein YabQ [Clostridium sp.]
MSMTIQYEAQRLVAGLVTGMILMTVYDCLRFFRMVVHHKNLWTGIEDVIYWIFCSIVTFMLLLNQNDGALRGYVIVGVLLGMVLYDVSISLNLLKLLKKCKKYFTIKDNSKKEKKT